MDERKDPNQGEGDRTSARRYDEHVEGFIAEGKVESAAREAEEYVEREPKDAARAERTARRGPHGLRGTVEQIVEEVVGKGRSLLERMRARMAHARR
jgi:hypothetical protein